ncbi:MAG: hypothetical protein IKP92_08435 [Lachnospiraceae bacterium]|nr:hypothetical protein [Lachnospiraceae bacterium]
MEGNYGNGFNQDPNGFNQDSYGTQDPYANPNAVYESNPQKQFSEANPDHFPADVQAAKNSLTCGILALLGSIFCIFMFFVLQRIAYVLNICLPIVSIYGIVSAIKALKNDKGIPQAYIGLIISILSVIPAGISFLLFILNFVACVAG